LGTSYILARILSDITARPGSKQHRRSGPSFGELMSCLKALAVDNDAGGKRAIASWGIWLDEGSSEPTNVKIVGSGLSTPSELFCSAFSRGHGYDTRTIVSTAKSPTSRFDRPRCRSELPGACLQTHF
jgi:hypothetical protein